MGTRKFSEFVQGILSFGRNRELQSETQCEGGQASVKVSNIDVKEQEFLTQEPEIVQSSISITDQEEFIDERSKNGEGNQQLNHGHRMETDEIDRLPPKKIGGNGLTNTNNLQNVDRNKKQYPPDSLQYHLEVLRGVIRKNVQQIPNENSVEIGTENMKIKVAKVFNPVGNSLNNFQSSKMLDTDIFDEDWDDLPLPPKNRESEDLFSDIIDENSTINFSNLQGFHDHVKYLQENVVIPWANRDVLFQNGTKLPKGLVFCGPTCSGQTLLAKALTAELSRASHQSFNFFQRWGADILKKSTGEIEKYIKRIFEVPTDKKPSVILLNSIDTILMYSTSSGEGGRILENIIEELDQVIVGEVLVIATVTKLKNFPSPLLKQGRFTKFLAFDVLNTIQRRTILESYSSVRVRAQKPSSQILDEISEKSNGFLDYELEKICYGTKTSAILRQIENRTQDSTVDYETDPIDSTMVLPEDWISAFERVKEEYITHSKLYEDTYKNDSEICGEILLDESLNFASLDGMDEEIKFLQDNIIIPMVNQEILLRHGLQPPKGIILHGPGSGHVILVKTLVAELSRHMAQPYSFFQRRASDIFSERAKDNEKFIDEIFAAAASMKPAVIFLDEIDTICWYSNSSGSRIGNGVKILSEQLSTIKAGEIIVIAGTKELSKVDPHLMGGGRFEKCVRIDFPNEERSIQIIKSYTSKWNQNKIHSTPDDFLDQFLQKVKYFSEDDLERICRETFISSLRREIKSVDQFKLKDTAVSVRITPEDWTSGLASVEKYKSSINLNSINLEKQEDNFIRPEVIDKNLRFSSIIGLDEEIKILCESVHFPMVKEYLSETTLMKGIMFYGNDSSGQLLLAKTLAAELSRSLAQDVHFFQRQKSDIFSCSSFSENREKFLRRIFATAIDMKPSIVFLDDFDTLCSTDFENSVKIFLEQMDLITPGEVIVIAATKNLFEVIPSPLLRRGYLEKSIIFNPPSDERRAAILKSLISSTSCVVEADDNETHFSEIINDVAKSTVGFLEEDLEQVFRESYMLAMRRRSVSDAFLNELNPKEMTIDLCDWKKGITIVEKDINSKKLIAGNGAYSTDEESRFKIYSERIHPISNSGFDSIHGMEKQIKFVQENIVFPMVNQESLANHDLEPIKGIMFYGPSGLGQLALAKALTAELSQKLDKSFTFFHRRTSDAYPKWSGDAIKFIKRLFASAIIQKPSIIFIEDLPTLCNFTDHAGPDKTVKIMSDQMEKFQAGEVIVIASALTLDEVYPPLLRIGFLEKSIEFSSLSDEHRSHILESNSSKWSENEVLSKEDSENIVMKTKDFNEHDMERLCRRTRMLAFQRKIDRGNTDKVKARSTDGNGEGIQITPDDWTSSLDDIGKDEPCSDKIKSSKDDKEENTIHSEIIEASVGFCSLGGLEDQMKVIRDSVMFPIINKSALMDWGVEPIKGVIFHGPPGTGKTLLAKALASELSRLGEEPFTFFYQKGTQALQKYVGWTESYLRKLFAIAVTKKPAIIFFDEIDGIFAARGEGSDTIYHNGIVSTLLGLLDTVKRGEILVIAATNRFHSLDPAMIRPGRFDKQIAFFPPKEEGRKRILEIHTSKWKDGQWKISLVEIAKQTEGYTGADLEQLCRETFHSALGRQFPSLETNTDTTKIPAGGFEHFDITLLDWYTALSKVKMSCSGVFGNAITSGKAISPDIAKLISGIELEIMEKLKVFLKVSTRVIVPGDGNEKGAGIKSILVWSKGIQQIRFFENFIIPSLIGSPALKDVNLFTLGSDKYDIPSINGIMKQILTSPKTAILFIPRIDQLVTKLVQLETHHLFMKQMDSLRGENVIVLASAGCPISELPDDIRCVFKGMEESKSYKIRKFENAERREFFKSILCKNYPTLLDRVEVLTSAANFYDLLDLKAELNHCFASGKENNLNVKQLGLGVNGILDIYETKKLDHTGTSNYMYS